MSERIGGKRNKPERGKKRTISSLGELGEALQMPARTSDVPPPSDEPQRQMESSMPDDAPHAPPGAHEPEDTSRDTAETAAESAPAGNDERATREEWTDLIKQTPRVTESGIRFWQAADGAVYIDAGGSVPVRVAHGGKYHYKNKQTKQWEDVYWDTNENTFTDEKPSTAVADSREAQLSQDVVEQERTNASNEYRPGELEHAQNNLRNTLASFSYDENKNKEYEDRIVRTSSVDDVITIAEEFRKELVARQRQARAEERAEKKKKRDEVQTNVDTVPASEPVREDIAQPTPEEVAHELAEKKRALKQRVYALKQDHAESLSDGRYQSLLKDIDDTEYKEVLIPLEDQISYIESEVSKSGSSFEQQGVSENQVEEGLKGSEAVNTAVRYLLDGIAAGIPANTLYLSARRKLHGSSIPAFDRQIKKIEKLKGIDIVKTGAASPAERLPKAGRGGGKGGGGEPPKPPEGEPEFPGRPEWAGQYFKNTNGKDQWYTFDRRDYRGITPLTLEEIRKNATYNQLFGEFMVALHGTSEILDRLTEGKDLDDAQKKVLDFAQHEFTRQMQRAEQLEKDFDLKLFKAIIGKNDTVRRLSQTMGAEHVLNAYKKQLKFLAVRDRGTFDAFAATFARMNDPELEKRARKIAGQVPALFKGFGMAKSIYDDVVQDRIAAREDLGKLLDTQLTTAEFSAGLYRQGFTGAEPNKSPTEGGPKSADDIKSMQASITSAMLKQAFDRDKMGYRVGDRGWDELTTDEQVDFRDRVWNPPEVRKHAESKALGLWAQVGAALAKMMFKETRRKIAID